MATADVSLDTARQRGGMLNTLHTSSLTRSLVCGAMKLDTNEVRPDMNHSVRNLVARKRNLS